MTVPRNRLTFARFPEVQDLPDLTAIQRDSFNWFLTEGLKEVFRDMSPIEDFTGNLALQFLSHRFEPPKFNEDECKEKDL
ncbi:MAG: hypothetical protein ACRDI1_09105, partial [Actinomycetota bacterium]